jgi:hypothetical protein
VAGNIIPKQIFGFWQNEPSYVFVKRTPLFSASTVQEFATSYRDILGSKPWVRRLDAFWPLTQNGAGLRWLFKKRN